ncbi:peptidylprolyl isomerase [Ensifer sp. P24N7]|uniref:peptidylprolyl isomerase n=1 Tax=Sinorhizobium sp. P24N7 TaxID=3348358 RepID=UPI0035F36509
MTLKSIQILPLALSAILLLGPTSAPAQEGRDEVLARVNGTEIRASDTVIAEQMYGGLDASATPEAKRSALVDALIELKVVSDAAIEAGVENDSEYQRQIALLKQQALRAAYVKKLVSDVVTEEAVSKAYADRIGSIPAVEEIRLKHIVVATEQDAATVIEGLKSGKTFEDLAQQYSNDEVSKAKGGDLGFVAVGQLLPELDAAAATMKAGDVSATAIKSTFGYHVLKLEERRQRPVPPLSEVAGQIRASLEQAAAQQVVQSLKAKGSIEKLIPDVPVNDAHAHEEQSGE